MAHTLPSLHAYLLLHNGHCVLNLPSKALSRIVAPNLVKFTISSSSLYDSKVVLKTNKQTDKQTNKPYQGGGAQESRIRLCPEVFSGPLSRPDLTRTHSLTYSANIKWAPSVFWASFQELGEQNWIRHGSCPLGSQSQVGWQVQNNCSDSSCSPIILMCLQTQTNAMVLVTIGKDQVKTHKHVQEKLLKEKPQNARSVYKITDLPSNQH